MKQWSALLAQELNSWSGVTSRPLFSMTAFYRAGRIFAVVPRTKAFETPNSVGFKLYRESRKTSKLVRADARIRLSTGKKMGWNGFELDDASDLRDALKWFDLAYRSCVTIKLKN